MPSAGVTLIAAGGVSDRHLGAKNFVRFFLWVFSDSGDIEEWGRLDG